MRTARLFAACIAALMLLSACAGAGKDVRPVDVRIADNGCASVPIIVEPGQQLRLDISNESSQPYKVAAPEGGFETFDIAPSETFEGFYFVPEGDASYAIFCTGKDGSRSSIDVRAHSSRASGTRSGSPTLDAPAEPPGADSPETTLAVTLVEYTVTTSTRRLSSGRVKIIATNISGGQAHELNVLALQPDGSFLDSAVLAAIEPQNGGALLVTLQPGTYRLACLIGIGESGSTVDHYQQGMWTDIIVSVD